MSNKKQPSVEWLFRKLWDSSKDKLTWYAFLKEAMEMHRDEIIDANEDSNTLNGEFLTGEQYYRETYGL